MVSGTAVVIGAWPSPPEFQRYWPLVSLSWRMRWIAKRWKPQRAVGQYCGFKKYLATINWSAVELVVEPVWMSRAVEIPEPLVVGVITPRGCCAPLPSRKAFSWVIPNL